MRKIGLRALPLAFVLSGCGYNGADQTKSEASPSAMATLSSTIADDALAARDPADNAALDPSLADDIPRPLMQAQVVLDRLGFSPGVIDGKAGLSSRNALNGFQEANGLQLSGILDEDTIRALGRWENIAATRMVTIPKTFAEGPFRAVPKDPADQAKMVSLGYESLEEKLAERFHTTVALLKELNPANASAASGAPASAPPTSTASYFHAGQKIRVPNVGHDTNEPGAVKDQSWSQTLTSLGVGSNQTQASQIVVSKSSGTLKVFDKGGKLIAAYTATIGSQHDPLPLGKWKILGIVHNPPFNYNPDLFWDAGSKAQKALLPPGPNGPVGVVWIDLSKPHYGIHGTPHPETIGRAESHGCVRLTNWDAARLAQMVSLQTRVLFTT